MRSGTRHLAFADLLRNSTISPPSGRLVVQIVEILCFADSRLGKDTCHVLEGVLLNFFFFFFTLVTGPRRSLSLKLTSKPRQVSKSNEAWDTTLDEDDTSCLQQVRERFMPAGTPRERVLY